MHILSASVRKLSQQIFLAQELIRLLRPACMKSGFASLSNQGFASIPQVKIFRFFLPVLLFSVLNCEGQAIHFNLPDYADLGLLDNAVRPGFEELNAIEQQEKVDLDYAGLVARTLAQAGDITFVENLGTHLATLTESAKKITAAGGAENLQELASALSPIDIAPAQNTLSRLQSQLRTLNEQITEPVLPITLYVAYVVQVSGEGRQLVTQRRDAAVAGRASLLTALNNSAPFQDILEAYQNRLWSLSREINAAVARIEPFLKVPLVNLVVKTTLEDLLAIEAQITFLIPDVASTIAQIRPTQIRVSQLMHDYDDLIAGLTAALAAPPITSSWVTAGDVGNENVHFILSFSGTSFSVPFAEIRGPFLIGTLTVLNLISPAPNGDESLSAFLGFTVQRTVNDPILGEVITTSTVNLPMVYTATLNDPDNPFCGPSRDFFSVPAIGKSILICETASRSFQVWGQYDSPLRIVAMVPLDQKDDSGPIDQEPATTAFAYTLNVKGGTGSGVYPPNHLITLNADQKEGSRFVGWRSDVENLIDSNDSPLTLVMPSADVNIKAVFVPIRPQYQLNVMNGTGSGLYEAGSVVGIRSTVPEGSRFVRWTGHTGNIGDATAPASFIQVNSDLTIDAEIVENLKGDINGDGVVDNADLSIILRTLRSPASRLGDPRDLNNDGRIDVLDARIIVTLFSPTDVKPKRKGIQDL